MEDVQNLKLFKENVHTEYNIPQNSFANTY